jgi:hypothetical protein
VGSVTEAAREVPFTGAGACPVKKIVRSHVGNGAVNGVSVRKTSQAEISFPNIEVFLERSQD